MAESLYDHALDAPYGIPSVPGPEKASGEIPYPGGPGRVDENGNCEIRPDPNALRRNVGEALKFLLFAALLVPLIYAVLTVGPWNVALDAYVGLLPGIGFVLVVLAPVYAIWRVLYYRCPRCDRRLKHIPQEDKTAHILEHCPDCQIIWNLGFGWMSDGGGGD
jgi:hypothetical protein